MGIRCTQWIGLSDNALDMVKGDEVLLYTESGVRTYPDGREEAFERPVRGSTVEMIQNSTRYTMGMFDEEIPLAQVRMTDVYGRMGKWLQ